MEVVQGLADKQVGVSLHVFLTTDFEKTPQFLGVMEAVPPELIKETGLHPLIKKWSGGGTYKIDVRAPGVSLTVPDIKIAGTPQEPSINGHPTTGVPAAAIDINGPGQPGAGGNPQWAAMMGLQNNARQAESSLMRDMMQMMMFKDQFASAQAPAGPSPEIAALTVQINALTQKDSSKEMQAMLERQEQRHRDDMLRMETLVKDLNKAPDRSPTVEIATALAPVAAAFVSGQQEAKSREAVAASENTRAIMGLTENSSKQALEFATLMAARPTAEDRGIKMSSAYADTMANMGQFFGTMINGIMAQQAGPEQPPWLQALSMLAGGATNVLQSMVGPIDENYEESGVQTPDGPVQVQAPANAQRLPSGKDAGAEARARIGAGETEGVVMAAVEGQAAGIPAAEPSMPPRENFDGAMEYIFGLIEGGGDLNEVSARIYKHGYYGKVQVARGWYDNPEEATAYILSGLRAREELDVPDEQIHGVTDALVALHQYLDVEGNTIESFIDEYDLNLKHPRIGAPENVVAPDPSGHATSSGSFGEAVAEAPVQEIPATMPENSLAGNSNEVDATADEVIDQQTEESAGIATSDETDTTEVVEEDSDDIDDTATL